MDFYRMASHPHAPPPCDALVEPALAFGIYMTLSAFDLTEVPALLTSRGWGWCWGCSGACALIGGPALIRAVGWWRAFQRLPFPLEGLGRLVHRAESNWRTFIRCSLSLRLKETESSVPSNAVNSARATALQLTVDRINATITRIVGTSEFFRQLRWKVRDNKAEGYANWRVGGQLMAVCAESLVPLQRELGLIEAVTLEPLEESLFLPDND